MARTRARSSTPSRSSSTPPSSSPTPKAHLINSLPPKPPKSAPLPPKSPSPPSLQSLPRRRVLFSDDLIQPERLSSPKQTPRRLKAILKVNNTPTKTMHYTKHNFNPQSFLFWTRGNIIQLPVELELLPELITGAIAVLKDAKFERRFEVYASINFNLRNNNQPWIQSHVHTLSGIIQRDIANISDKPNPFEIRMVNQALRIVVYILGDPFLNLVMAIDDCRWFYLHSSKMILKASISKSLVIPFILVLKEFKFPPKRKRVIFNELLAVDVSENILFSVINMKPFPSTSLITEKFLCIKSLVQNFPVMMLNNFKHWFEVYLLNLFDIASPFHTKVIHNAALSLLEIARVFLKNKEACFTVSALLRSPVVPHTSFSSPAAIPASDTGKNVAPASASASGFDTYYDFIHHQISELINGKKYKAAMDLWVGVSLLVCDKAKGLAAWDKFDSWFLLACDAIKKDPSQAIAWRAIIYGATEHELVLKIYSLAPLEHLDAVTIAVCYVCRSDAALMEGILARYFLDTGAGSAAGAGSASGATFATRLLSHILGAAPQSYTASRCLSTDLTISELPPCDAAKMVPSIQLALQSAAKNKLELISALGRVLKPKQAAQLVLDGDFDTDCLLALYKAYPVLSNPFVPFIFTRVKDYVMVRKLLEVTPPQKSYVVLLHCLKNELPFPSMDERLKLCKLDITSPVELKAVGELFEVMEEGFNGFAKSVIQSVVLLDEKTFERTLNHLAIQRWSLPVFKFFVLLIHNAPHNYMKQMTFNLILLRFDQDETFVSIIKFLTQQRLDLELYNIRKPMMKRYQTVGGFFSFEFKRAMKEYLEALKLAENYVLLDEFLVLDLGVAEGVAEGCEDKLPKLRESVAAVDSTGPPNMGLSPETGLKRSRDALDASEDSLEPLKRVRGSLEREDLPGESLKPENWPQGSSEPLEKPRESQLEPARPEYLEFIAPALAQMLELVREVSDEELQQMDAQARAELETALLEFVLRVKRAPGPSLAAMPLCN